MKKFLIAFALVLAVARGASAADNLTSATCPGTGCIVYDVTNQGTIGIQVTGTFVGTLQFEQTVDGSTYATLSMLPNGITTAVTSATATGLWSGVTTAKQVRVRFSAYTSGTATISVVSTQSKAGGSGGLTTVTEANLSFSDVTTANATSSAHGLMPKLSGNAYDFTLGDGTYGRTVARGTTTANSPWSFTQTWNNGAVDFVGLAFTFTNTASSSGAFVTFNTGAGEVGRITIGGQVQLPSATISTFAGNVVQLSNTGSIAISDGTDFNGSIHRVSGGSGGLRIGDGSTGWQEIQTRDVKLVPNAVAQPACAVGIRGTLWYTSSANGVADKMEVCAKSSLDAYAWRAMATIP